MVSFVTLILTLLSGTYPVEVLVDPTVAQVDIHLDGEVVGRLTGEPWRLDVDFGEALQPHELVAVARDARGRELSRARQMVNLPRPPAEVTLSLAKGSDGRYRTARAAWESARNLDVQAMRALFDGSPLEVTSSGRIELPPYDPDVLHHLVVQIRFEGDLRAEATVALGGTYGETSQTELTAVAVALRDGVEELPDESLEGWFLLRGRPLTVAAVDRPPAEVFIVRDPSSEAHLDLLKRPTMRYRAHFGVRGARDGLRPDDAVHLVDTIPQLEDRDHGPPARLYPVSPDLSQYHRARGVTWTLTSQQFEERNPGNPHLAQAVATAALRAAGLGSPRVILLALGPTAKDHGPYGPRDVLRYLEALQVPFLLWFFEGEEESGEPPVIREWGAVTKISSPQDFFPAIRELQSLLERQRIVWVKGLHLPQHIELSAAARDYIELAGR